jgi:hypothetical protein
MNKYLQRFATSLIFALTLESSQLSYASDESFPFEALPKGVRGIVIKQAAAERIADGKNLSDIAVVKKEWREFVNEGVQPWGPCWKAYLGVTPANENLYRIFFNGILECRKDPDDKSPAYIRPLLPLMNLSVKVLDLPTDIDAIWYYMITDNLQLFFEVVGDKCRILIATKSMIAMRMKSMKMSDELKAKLDDIMTKWDDSTAPVGFFWRYGAEHRLTWFEYLITQNLSSISSCNLFENWEKSVQSEAPTGRGPGQRNFLLRFESKLELRQLPWAWSMEPCAQHAKTLGKSI